MSITKSIIRSSEIMKMHNPPHPGEIIKGLWLDPMGVIQASKGDGRESQNLVEDHQ